MAAIVLKNTFWEVVAEDLHPGSHMVRRRFRTEEWPRFKEGLSEEEDAAAERISAQACRLCALLGAREAQCDCAARSATPALDGEVLLRLKPTLSNSSMSTMAPQDDDMLEEHPEHHCSHSGHCEQAEHGPRGANFNHGMVPRRQNFTARPEQSALGAPTTMMLRNIPNRYTQKELMAEIESLGFAGTFNFFYSPMDTGSMGNVGYAFVNFVDGVPADRFFQTLPGHQFRKHQQRNKPKVASVSEAHLQGLEANVQHYAQAAVNNRGRSRRPVVMPLLSGVQ